MGQIDPRVDTPLVDWSELGMSGLLPTGTVTLVLADVEGSTRLHAVVGDPTRGNDRGDRAATEEAVACA